jgi:hypothetical protein
MSSGKESDRCESDSWIGGSLKNRCGLHEWSALAPTLLRHRMHDRGVRVHDLDSSLGLLDFGDVHHR